MLDYAMTIEDMKPKNDTRKYFYDMIAELVQVALSAGEFEAASTLLTLVESKGNFQPAVHD